MAIEDEFTRYTRAMERIAAAFERMADVMEKKFAREFPEPKVKRDAEIIQSSASERAEQYSDKAGPEWFGEQPAGSEPVPSRFEERFKASKSQKKAAPQRRTREVSQGDGDKAKPN